MQIYVKYNTIESISAQAMIVGARHFRTFDGRHFNFAGAGTYLLACDFIQDHFAFLIKYTHHTNASSHQIIVLVGNSAIQLDTSKDVSHDLETHLR